MDCEVWSSLPCHGGFLRGLRQRHGRCHPACPFDLPVLTTYNPPLRPDMITSFDPFRDHFPSLNPNCLGEFLRLHIHPMIRALGYNPPGLTSHLRTNEVQPRQIAHGVPVATHEDDFDRRADV